MPFKDDWEKADQLIHLPEDIIQAMVADACGEKALLSAEVISGGCANLNAKLNFKGESCPLILRVYLRDQAAAFREKNLFRLLKTFPLPEIYHVGVCEGYTYSIAKYLPGISLSTFLQTAAQGEVQGVMHEAGEIVSRIQEHTFPHAGFFDANLNVTQPTTKQSHLDFGKGCLEDPLVLKALGEERLERIRGMLETFADLFPDESERHLVHGDYDPANILVDNIKGQWKISGILDWEFAFSGSWLQDVANMLRYAHQMPPLFEDSFLEGLRRGGLSLPEDWRKTVDLLNLLALLDLLIRTNPQLQPKRYQDICALIGELICFQP